MSDRVFRIRTPWRRTIGGDLRTRKAGDRWFLYLPGTITRRVRLQLWIHRTAMRTHFTAYQVFLALSRHNFQWQAAKRAIIDAGREGRVTP